MTFWPMNHAPAVPVRVPAVGGFDQFEAQTLHRRQRDHHVGAKDRGAPQCHHVFGVEPPEPIGFCQISQRFRRQQLARVVGHQSRGLRAQLRQDGSNALRHGG